MDLDRLVSPRSRAVDASGIRRIFDLGAKLKDPINLSIGQPDFQPPEAVLRAAAEAIASGANGYSPTQGLPILLDRVIEWLRKDLAWEAAPCGRTAPEQASLLITSGTSGALTLAFQALLGPGDEAIIPDPYFVAYPHMVSLLGAKAVVCDTRPDYRMTAERVEPLITESTKLVLLNTPSNPCGAVLDADQCRELRELCVSRNVLLISDEIYDEFTYPESATDTASGDASLARCPSPCRVPGSQEDTLLIRGFGKTYGCTGWRLGYAAGPSRILDEMGKLQQYSYVCAPTPLQAGVAECFDADLSPIVDEYRARRDLVVDRLSGLTELPTPGGAFYAYPKVPESLGLTGTQFVERCIDKNVLVIPGGVFSGRDDAFRISYATKRAHLEAGLDIIADLLRG